MRIAICRALRWHVIMLLLTTAGLATVGHTSEAPVALQIADKPTTLEQWEQAYLQQAGDRLYASCERHDTAQSNSGPDDKNNQLILPGADGSKRIIQAIGGSSSPFRKMAFYELDGNTLTTFGDCQPQHVMPIAGIMEALSLKGNIPERRTRAGLSSYQPNRIGYVYDDNDVSEGYMDAVLSLKYPLFHDGIYSDDSSFLNPYFAFTGRFSQYVESRESSPVIGRSYNPKFFLRNWLGDDSRYLDLGIAHESNGQNIDSANSYVLERLEFQRKGEDPDFARDYISRGWDYLSLDWKHSWYNAPGIVDTFVILKYFLDDGPFQGEPEESNDWEGFGEHKRKQYDGLGFLGKYRFDDRACLVKTPRPSYCLRKFAWLYTTGYDGIFDNNTNRVEFTVDLGGVPIMFWGQKGYNSDLVDYYQKVKSWGVTLELNSATLR
jgi:outer membrane phospholipase A